MRLHQEHSVFFWTVVVLIIAAVIGSATLLLIRACEKKLPEAPTAHPSFQPSTTYRWQPSSSVRRKRNVLDMQREAHRAEQREKEARARETPMTVEEYERRRKVEEEERAWQEELRRMDIRNAMR